MISFNRMVKLILMIKENERKLNLIRDGGLSKGEILDLSFKRKILIIKNVNPPKLLLNVNFNNEMIPLRKNHFRVNQRRGGSWLFDSIQNLLNLDIS